MHERMEKERARMIAEAERQRAEVERLEAERIEKEKAKLKPLTQGFEVGDKVIHKIRGEGIVKDIMGNLITIGFPNGRIIRCALNQLLENDLIKKA